MIAVIFGVTPKAGTRAEYPDLAAETRPLVEKIDGFVSAGRFESPTPPGKLASMFRDRGALGERCRVTKRRAMHSRGRHRLLADCRPRATGAIRDHGPPDRAEAPADTRPPCKTSGA